MKKPTKQQTADAAMQAHVLLGDVMEAYKAIDSIEANPTGRWKTWATRFPKVLEAHPNFDVDDAKSFVHLLRSDAAEKSSEAYQLITSVAAYFKAEAELSETLSEKSR